MASIEDEQSNVILADNHLVGKRRSRPMTQLRWKKTVVIDDFIGTQKYELQQLWTGDFGDQEWRPIEFVE